MNIRYILTAALVLVFLTGCQTMSQRVQQELEANCQCKKIEQSPFSTKEVMVFDLYDCVYTDDFAEAKRLMQILDKNIEGFCGMEGKFVLEFVTNKGMETKYHPHSYRYCTPQLEF